MRRRSCFRSTLCLSIVGLLFTIHGCSQPRAQPKPVRLATTTSARDSGLLDVLIPLFEEKTGIKVLVIAVGSGQAIELGRRGDADILLTHSPAAEKSFVADGHGEERQSLMHNDFMLVGPEMDPAAVKGMTSITDAFRQVANSKQSFVSRGDESGTHIKERQIWKQAEMEPEGEWYVRAGTGMAEVLRMAQEKKAYTLTDRGTYLTQRGKLNLVILAEGDDILMNPYSVTVVSASKHANVNNAAARQFAQFLLSPDVQQAIGEYGVKEFGQPLFFPDALQSP